jgi:hypothetical protein
MKPAESIKRYSLETLIFYSTAMNTADTVLKHSWGYSSTLSLISKRFSNVIFFYLFKRKRSNVYNPVGDKKLQIF